MKRGLPGELVGRVEDGGSLHIAEGQGKYFQVPGIGVEYHGVNVVGGYGDNHTF